MKLARALDGSTHTASPAPWHGRALLHLTASHAWR